MPLRSVRSVVKRNLLLSLLLTVLGLDLNANLVLITDKVFIQNYVRVRQLQSQELLVNVVVIVLLLFTGIMITKLVDIEGGYVVTAILV